MKRILASISVCVLIFSQGFGQIKSPDAFLPNYGKTVTYYHQVEDYFKHLTNNSKNIQHLQYGVTPQERALNVYFISSEENLKNLEAHRKNHLYEVGLFPTKTNTVVDKNILWLSFNVHGNEIGSIESSLKIAYELLKEDNSITQSWLKDNIIIMDPCLNPDGFARYANWLRDISGSKTHPGLADREHMEPWPGGRQNHYVFDLNRDWAWQTQPESQLRMDLYHQWMPMIHADVHEMGYNEPYFFPPAAEPFHEQISDFQRNFHKKVGELTSKKFDKEGWLYYSGERFDLFYPSYGDTYPSFNGAIGMTYEQGGIGAGRAVQMKNGEILTIQDRIDHHTTAILAVIELSQVMKDELRKNFRDYFKQSRQKPKGVYQTYVIKNSPKNLELLTLFNRNRIEANFANETRKLSGYHYQSDKSKNFTVEPDDLIIQTDQPRAVLTQVLMEPHHKLADSLSYDITAWALPLAYGVEAYALKNKTIFQTKTSSNTFLEERPLATVYAFYVPWNNRTSAKILSELHQQKIKTRYCQKPSKLGGISLERGTLIITKADNISIENFEIKVATTLKQKSDFGILQTGFGEQGGDLGGENYPLLVAPKIMLLGGYGVSNIDFGQVWFYLDQVVEYPVSVVELQHFSSIPWGEYNTLILPSGWYNFNELQMKTIDDFILKGGKVIAMDFALTLFEDREGYLLTSFTTDDEKSIAKKERDEEVLRNRYLDFESNERRSISQMVPGAIVENRIDTTHPLGYGLGDRYFSLKTSERNFKLLKNAQNVVFVPKNYTHFGFIGGKLKKKLEETVTFAVDNKGSGKVIYMIDNPLFRGFWENGNLLFSNALFLVH